MAVAEKKQNEPVIIYKEKKHGNTLYCMTNIHKDEIKLKTALEDLAISKILRDINTVMDVTL
jgi:hypothetical protein